MLYHRDIYLPLEYSFEVYCYKGQPLTLTNHAIEQADNEDVYGPFKIPKIFSCKPLDIIEVEINLDGEVSKCLIRVENPEDRGLDISIVVLLPQMIVKTVWQNEKNDTHENLSIDKYVPAPESSDEYTLKLKEYKEDFYPLNPKYDTEAGRDVQ